MIRDVERFFDRILSEEAMKAMRDTNAATYEHRLLIKKTNIINMMVDRVIAARSAAGLPRVSKKVVSDIIKTAIWNNIYTEANIRRAFRKFYGSTGKKSGVFVKPGKGGSIQVIFYKGAYAETRKSAGLMTAKGVSKSLQSLTNAAMADLWYQAMTRMKLELGKRSGLKDLFGDPIPETFGNIKHPGQRNHGDIGQKGGFQTTVANMKLAEGEGAGFDDAVQNLKQNMDDEYPGESQMVDTVINQIFNPIKKKYKIKDVQDFSAVTGLRDISVTIEYGDQAHNAGMGWADVGGIKDFAALETQRLVNHLEKESGKLAEDIGGLKGSDSFNTKATKIARTRLIEELLKTTGSRPDFRLKVNKRLLEQAKKAKGKKSTQGSIDKATKAASKVILAKAAKSVSVRQGRKNSNKRGASRTAQSPIALRNLLNEALPQAVAQNMGSPALNYRTGRFANSVRVENLVVGPRGGTHIDYTYMREPYETFEPGGKQGSVQRDPRRLIGKTIRELAVGILGKQPTTLRRT